MKIWATIAVLVVAIAVPAWAQATRHPVLPVPEGQPEAQQERPRALVIEVKGTAQWRPTEKARWQKAKVNDVLEAGAEVRTGLRSRVALRAGKNATIVVDRSTRLVLPVMLQEGNTLRTRAAIRRGRADFKVDLIGLTNDFEVLTPSTTLAVRGTGFAVKWGALAGAEVEEVTADVLAIELRYLLTEIGHVLDSRGVSSETHPDPVIAALFETFLRPRPALSQGEYASELVDEAFLRDPRLQWQRDVEHGLASTQRVQDFVLTLSPEVQFICNNLAEFFGAYFQSLAFQLGFESLEQIDTFYDLVEDIASFCAHLEGFTGDPFEEITQQIDAFCQTYSDPLDVERCKALFHDLLDIP
jgi:hypothetical protein